MDFQKVETTATTVKRLERLSVKELERYLVRLSSLLSTDVIVRDGIPRAVSEEEKRAIAHEFELVAEEIRTRRRITTTKKKLAIGAVGALVGMAVGWMAKPSPKPTREPGK